MTDLRYPVGKFESRSKLNPDERLSMIEQIAAAPARMREAVRGLGYYRRFRMLHEAAKAMVGKAWPTTFEAKRSRELGFMADANFEAIVRAHVEDEHGGRAPVMG